MAGWTDAEAVTCNRCLLTVRSLAWRRLSFVDRILDRSTWRHGPRSAEQDARRLQTALTAGSTPAAAPSHRTWAPGPRPVPDRSSIRPSESEWRTRNNYVHGDDVDVCDPLLPYQTRAIISSPPGSCDRRP